MKGKNNGKFLQKKDGSWSINTQVKINGKWTHFSKSGYSTLKEAKLDYERAEKEFINAKSLVKNTNTFESLIEEYLSYRKTRYDYSTVCQDGTILKVFCEALFGKEINEVLNQKSMEEWYNNLINNDTHSDSRKQRGISKLRDVIHYAYTRKHIDAITFQDCDVVLTNLKVNKKAVEERIIWTNEEQTRFLNSIKNKGDYLMYALSLVLGTRIGEFLAIQPSSINFQKHSIVIDHQVKQVRGNGASRLDKLKTYESYREITIPEDLCSLLYNRIKDLGIKDNEYVFFGSKKSVPISRNTYRRKLYEYCDKANVRRINPHAMRHSVACKLASYCSTGEDYVIAAKRLGHSPAMFMNTYANHTTEEKDKEMLERLWK